MSHTEQAVVPVWTLATGEVQVPALAQTGAMSSERLSEMRGVLAALADRPIVTLEAHPLPGTFDRSRGIALDAASPLAGHLSQLIEQTARTTTEAVAKPASGEVLYRMVVPAKVAAQVSQGVVRPMRADGSGGIYGALRGATGIIGQGKFVPVAPAASAGGAAATAGATALGGVAVTVAAPLVLMALAVGASAHAEHRRQQAIERITGLLEQLRDDALDAERADLEGCRDAVEKATAVLLDQGQLGVSLGLDSAVHAIAKGLAAAERRVARWQVALEALRSDGPVDIDAVTTALPGVDKENGLFRAHLELAALAIALKQRVILLQAVEHAQGDLDSPFEHFTRSLRNDHARLDRLQSSIDDVLVTLSSLEFARPANRRPAFTGAQVDRLLRSTSSIRRLGDGVAVNRAASDVSIEIARSEDGSLFVLPAQAA